jgi:hypothetical protein
VRFEPGDTKEVELCELGGTRVCFGFNGLSLGSLKSAKIKKMAFEKAKFAGYKGMGT